MRYIKVIIILVVIIITSFSAIIAFPAEQSNVQITKSITSMPLAFTANQGQWDESVKFRANAGGATMWFSSDGAYYQFTRTIESEPQLGPVDPMYASGQQTPSSAPDVTLSGVEGRQHQPKAVETMMIKAHFVGSNSEPNMVGLNMMEYKCNYFIGNDQSKWHTDVSNYNAVLYEQVYDGIDLKYYGNGKQMEYDFIVSSGADYSQIKIQYEGAESISVNDNGELVVKTMWGEVVEQKPVVYQIVNNTHIAVVGEYSLKRENTFGFELKSNYDKSKTLIIDPVLTYSTYLGGSESDIGVAISVDSMDCIYVLGYTESIDFPTKVPYQVTLKGEYDIFITKISSTGKDLIYSTYLGGSESEYSRDMSLDVYGNVYICGKTYSTDFPIKSELQSILGWADVFVVKLNNSGNALVYSTILGGSLYDAGEGIVVDSYGNAYVTGSTLSTDYPIKGTLQDYNSSYDVFITKLDSSGNEIVYSTFLGGSKSDTGTDITIDKSGNAYVTGKTYSTDFPMKEAFQNTFNGDGSYSTDVFVTKLNNLGSTLIYSTYLGGSGSEEGVSIAVDDLNNTYVTGWTGSTDYPTKQEYQTDQNGYDAFVTKINSTGKTLVYSTYLGGSGNDHVESIAIDSNYNAYITGWTGSSDFPTENEYQLYQGGHDVFITKLKNYGNSLDYSTYFGGSSMDRGYSIFLDKSNSPIVLSRTISIDIPVVDAYQPSLSGLADVFVSKFSAVSTDIEELDFDNLPTEFKMSQNYPNPFNPTTTIEFNLPKRSMVTINIYNLLGQQVRQLVNQEYSAGNYKLIWDGTTSSGVRAATGIYLYRLETESFIETKKMLLLK